MLNPLDFVIFFFFVQPFIREKIPAGGLFTGAEQVKTLAQRQAYGGLAGAAYDVGLYDCFFCFGATARAATLLSFLISSTCLDSRAITRRATLSPTSTRGCCRRWPTRPPLLCSGWPWSKTSTRRSTTAPRSS